MGCCGFVVVVALGMAIRCALAQGSRKDAMDLIPAVTVCDIVHSPGQFKDKTVRVRGQIWSDLQKRDQFWVNQASFGKVCPSLPAKLQMPANFAGNGASGTFLGRVVVDTTVSGSNLLVGRGTQSKMFFVIEELSDLRDQQDWNGLVPIQRFYDSQSGSFVTP
ncbi:MAG TPA: hypothetical protein VN828_21665 [Acidobacteriaceae bacterium]|jgi:hypothetical protein|nr:hypothetical protein [Acidobacteriaceae bacterium]